MVFGGKRHKRQDYLPGFSMTSYRRYAISDEASLRESAKKLSALHEAELGSPRTVIPIKGESDRG